MRIVSLLPSATEIVYLLGLGDHLTGVSHECDYPKAALGKRKIITPAFESSGLSSREIDSSVRAFLGRGEGIYRIDLEALKAADPDLIVTQELCDVCAAPYQDVLEAVTHLSRKPEILSLNPQRLGDVLQDVERVGEATGRLREAAQAGGSEPLGKAGEPSERVAWERVLSCAPEILILMPCGFSVDRTLDEIHLLTDRPGWEGLPAVRRGKVFAVNGHAYFSRSGPRLVDGNQIFAPLLPPEP